MTSSPRSSLPKELEAVMMVSSDPISGARAAGILGVSIQEIQEAVVALSDFYDQSDRGFYIQEVAGGYRLAARPEMSEVLERFALSQTPPRLSSALLETLAIIAYRQPISKAQISAIRGVNSDHVIRMLTSRGYIEASARDSGAGGARYYRTTPTFLEKLGIFSISDLPKVEGFLPGPEVAEALEASLFDGDY